MSGPWSRPDPYASNKLIHHATAGICRHCTPSLLQSNQFPHPQTWWIKRNRIFMDQAERQELVCALPTHLLAGGERKKRLDTEHLWIQHYSKKRGLARNESKSNSKPELCKVSWCGAAGSLFWSLFFLNLRRSLSSERMCRLDESRY